MIVQITSKSTHIKGIDGHRIEYKGTAQVSPIPQTSVGPFQLRNIYIKILADCDTYVRPENDCPGEITLLQPFLKKLGLGFKNFFADKIDCLASIEFGELHPEKSSSKMGKLGRRMFF